MPSSSGTQREFDVSPLTVQQYLKGVHYPKGKSELISHARGQGAPDEVIAFMQQMHDKSYNSPVDVSKELGKHT